MSSIPSVSRLKKSISPNGLLLVAIGSCIGSGIFLTPSQIANEISSLPLILLVWVLGGVITLTGALSFSELAGMFPGAGGVYVYLKEVYGPAFGFLYGWAYLVVICSGAIAALCVAFARYVDYLVPVGPAGRQVLAVGAIVLVSIINIYRVRAGEMFSTLFTAFKLAGILAIILIGIGFGIENVYSRDWLIDPADTWNGFGLALIGVLWSYGGWQHATYLAGEVRNPQRVVPRAMIIGSIVVSAAYLAINLAYVCLLSVPGIAGSTSVAADALETVIPIGGTIIAVMIAVSVLGTAGIYTLSSPRIYFAMARDGIFFKQLGGVHPRLGTPAVAILAQSVWAVLLVLLWGTFEDLITYVVSVDWMFFCMTALGVLILRRRRPDLTRPYKVWGYPYIPMTFVTITALFVINTFIGKPLHAWVGLTFLGVGYIVYRIFLLFNRRAGGESSS